MLLCLVGVVSVSAWVSPRLRPRLFLPTALPGTLEFTPENVDSVLEEVRPYLISDGGNIKVLRIDPSTKDVFVELQGACGSCPSSTTTMKMGVEVFSAKYCSLSTLHFHSIILYIVKFITFR